MQAEFVNPSGLNWDYGFAIRNPVFGRLDIVGVINNKQWFHATREVEWVDYVWLQHILLSETKAEASNPNLLVLIAVRDVGWFFINGGLVGKLDLSHNQDVGQVGLLNGFLPNSQGTLEFRNFTVWVP